MRRSEARPLNELFGSVVVEPLFAGLEAGDHRMPRLLAVLRGMLTRRGIAAADVSAFGAPAEMQPPAVRC